MLVYGEVGVPKDGTWTLWPTVGSFSTKQELPKVTYPWSSKFYCIWNHVMEIFSQNSLPNISQIVSEGLVKWLAYGFSSQYKCLCQLTRAKSFPSKVLSITESNILQSNQYPVLNYKWLRNGLSVYLMSLRLEGNVEVYVPIPSTFRAFGKKLSIHGKIKSVNFLRLVIWNHEKD